MVVLMSCFLERPSWAGLFRGFGKELWSFFFYICPRAIAAGSVSYFLFPGLLLNREALLVSFSVVLKGNYSRCTTRAAFTFIDSYPYQKE